MQPSAGDDRPTEPDDPYATRPPSADTVEDLDRLAREAGGPGPGDAVPVYLAPDRPEFERALSAFGLMDGGSIEAFLRRFPEGQGPTGASGLARELVRAGLLTRYQASAILQGKAKVLAIGPYLVLDRLGSGAMGLVFEARHRETGDLVALKLLPPSASKQDHAVLRFRREAKIMAQLDHANIVASREIGEYNGVHYLVMDKVEGRDLHQLVRSDGPLGVRDAVGIVTQAARGLEAAHGRGVVHRDIKPANLMIDTEGTVRILDLGLARITQADDSPRSREPDPSLTHHGMIMGTVDFLPPEQSNNSKRADHRADIYSLGCTLHYLLTGRSPYAGETIMERLIAHHQQPVPSLLDSRPDVPAALDAVFRRMLDKDPERRHQSVSELIPELESSLVACHAAGNPPRPEDRRDPTSVARQAMPTAGRVAADRIPDGSDLSGYDVLPDSRAELWSPLLDDPPVGRPASSREGPSKREATPVGLEPSARRRWVGLALVGLLVLGIAMGVVAVVSIARALGSAIP